MNETFLSWLEFELILRRLEEEQSSNSGGSGTEGESTPKGIYFKREYVKEELYNEHPVVSSVRSHYRYRDFSSLNAYYMY